MKLPGVFVLIEVEPKSDPFLETGAALLLAVLCPDDSTFWQIPNVGNADDGSQVVLTKGLKGNIPKRDDLVITGRAQASKVRTASSTWICDGLGLCFLAMKENL
jgi:hypothetical protein